MGLSPGIQSFILGKKIKEDEARAQEAKKQQEIQNKQIEQDFKLRQNLFNLNKRKLEADLRRDEVEVETLLNEEKVAALQGERPLIREVQGPVNLFPDPNSGQAPQEQLQGQVFQTLTGEQEIPQEQIESASQFGREQSEQILQQLEQRSVAEDTGQFVREDLKQQGLDRRAEDLAKFKRKDRNQQHLFKLKELQEASRLRSQERLTELSAIGIKNAPVIDAEVEGIRTFRKSLEGIQDVKLREQVRLQLATEGIINFNPIQVRNSDKYRSGTSAINQIFSDFDEFIELSYGITTQELDAAEEDAHNLAAGKFRNETFGEQINRARLNISGFIEGALSSTRRTRLAERGFETGLVAVNEAQGGERGGKQSNLDLERARFNLPKLEDSLFDLLKKRRRFRSVFINQFKTVYGSANPEQQAEVLDSLNLPFGIPSISKKVTIKKQKGQSDFSSVTIEDQDIIDLARESGKSLEEVLSEVQK